MKLTFLLLLSIFALYYALNFSINLLFFSFVDLETFLVLLDMIQYHVQFRSVGMFSSVAQLCPTFCNPMDCSTPGFLILCGLGVDSNSYPVVGDVIQLSHLLSSPSPTFNLSQHQGLFQGVSSFHQVAKVLEFQHQGFQ